ncbi:MAG: SsrA-binding protein SmpB [Streptococcaceae bacterium]|jgi:SsrA-binding protein|nr:SsrA-binding protein SmpB [Streptococcaceae bacterium]
MAKKKTEAPRGTFDNPVASNKKASHDYLIGETFECGLVLTGTEIKSIRRAHIQLRDGFARVRAGEVFLSGVVIAHFEEGNIANVDEVRDRKLLMHKKQIAQVERALQDTGMTFVPLKVYFKNGFAKVLMGLAKGKHDYDKRNAIREKDQSRDMARQLKNYQTR